LKKNQENFRVRFERYFEGILGLGGVREGEKNGERDKKFGYDRL